MHHLLRQLSRQLSRIPIMWQFTLLVVVGFVIVSIVITGHFLRKQEEQVTTALKAKVASTTQMIAFAAAIATEAWDVEAINDALDWAKQDPELAFVYVLDKDKEIYAEFARDEDAKVPFLDFLGDTEVHEWQDTLVCCAVVGKGKKQYGHAVLGLSLNAVQQQISDDRRTGILLCAVVVGFGILAVIAVSRGIAGRLAALSGLAQDIADGDLQREPVHIGPEERDEVAVVTRAFNQVLASLSTLAREARSIAAGDLSREVPGKGDLVKAFSIMVQQLRDALAQINESVLALDSASNQILATTAEQERVITQQSTAITETTSTVQELSAAQRQVSGNATQVSELALSSDQAVDDGRVALTETASGLEDIRGKSEATAQRILMLSTKSQQVDRIAGTIRDISERINLLAINAAIEAARAGDQGRGFAVVAAEIRRLAEQTNRSTEEITRIVQDIQDSTNAAVLSTEDGMKSVTAGVGHARRAADTFDNIQAMVSSTADAVKQITLSTQQQSAGTDQITGAMREIAEGMQETVAGTKQTVAAAQQLRQLAEGLGGLVSRFQVNGKKDAAAPEPTETEDETAEALQGSKA